MKLLVLIASLALLQMVSAQCGKPVGDFADCLTGLFKAKLEKLPDKEKMKTDVGKCFTDSGCKDPKPPGGPDDDGDFSGFPMKGGMLKKIKQGLDLLGISMDMEQLKKIVSTGIECMLKNKDKAMESLSTCIKTKPSFNDFAVPAVFEQLLNKDEPKHAKMPAIMAMKFVHGGKGKKKMDPMKKIMKHAHKIAGAVLDDRVCATDDNKQKARSCLEALFDKNAPEEIKCKNPVQMLFMKVDKHKEFCSKVKECKAKMGDDCQEPIKQLPQLICDCAQTYLKANFDTLFATVKTCMKDTLGDALELNKLTTPLAKKAIKKLAQKGLTKGCEKLKRGPPMDVAGPCNGPPPFLRPPPPGRRRGDDSSEESSEEDDGPPPPPPDAPPPPPGERFL